MKKTFTLIAAMAVACSSVLAATETYTSSTKLSGTLGTKTECDLFSYISGNTNGYVTDEANLETYLNQSTGSINDVSHVVDSAGQATNSNAGMNSMSITLNELYNASTLPASVIIDSYSFITRHNNATTSNLYVQIIDSSNTVLGVSDIVEYDAAATGGSSTYGTGTFTFSDDIILSTTEAYTFRIFSTTSEETLKTAQTDIMTGANMAYGEFRPYSGYTIDGVGAGNYVPVIQVVTHAIPEPTTATLSLLALAGLAARRRRQ